MPIKVSCSCGQSFTAKDELAGQTLLCPKCHQPLTIGEQQSQRAGSTGSGGGIDDLFDEVGLKEVEGPRCPYCAAAMAPQAVICVECGYNKKTGEKLQGVQAQNRAGQGHTMPADLILERAQQQIESDRSEEKKSRSQGAPAWAYFLGLAIVMGFAATMLLLPRDEAFEITGWAIVGLGGLVALVFHLRILIVAFLERMLHGFLCLLVPPYILYYVATRWYQVGSFFLMHLGGYVIIAAGYGMIWLSPYMATEEEEEARRPGPPQVQVACVAAEEVGAGHPAAARSS